jgi:hypothetical protein
LLPEVISKNEPAEAAYRPDADWTDGLPANAAIEATIGEATLVPPNTSQPLWPPDGVLSYTQTPVAGSATAAISLTVRRAQPASCCQPGFGSYALQPLPLPPQTVSVALRVPEFVA